MTLTYRQQLRLFSHDVHLFLLSAVLVAFCWDGIRMVLSNLYLLRLGYGPELVGLINASNAMLYALACLPAGLMGARWSSRSLHIAGGSLMALGLILLPLSEFVPAGWRVGWLLGIGLPTYVGQAMYMIHGLPFAMDITQPGTRSHFFSLHIGLLPLAGFAGSLLAGFLPALSAAWLGFSLEEAATFRYPLLLNGLILIPAMLVLLRTTPTPGSSIRRARRRGSSARSEAAEPPVARRRPPYGLLLMVGLVMALRFGGRGTVQTFFNVYLDDGLGTSTALIGVLLAVAQLASVPAALAAPSLVVRRGPVAIISRGTVGVALATLPLVLVPHWTVAGLSYIASTAIFVMTIGPIRLYCQELVTPDWRTAMATAFMMGPGLAHALMSLAGGYAIISLGYELVFLVAAAVTAAGGLLFWAYFRTPRGELAPGDAAPGPDADQAPRD